MSENEKTAVQAASASGMNMRREARLQLLFLSAQFLLGMAVNLIGQPSQTTGDWALRIASRSARQIAAAKAVTDPIGTDELAAGFARELAALGALYPAPDSIVEVVRGAVADGAQTREGELDLEGAIERADAPTR